MRTRFSFRSFLASCIAGGALVLSAQGAVATFQQGVGGYSSGLDTSLYRADTTKKSHNYGGSTDIIVYGTGPENSPIGQALLRFNNIFGNGPGQVPVGSTINSATVRLVARTDVLGNGARKTFWSPMLVDVPDFGNKDDAPASIGEVSFNHRIVSSTGWGAGASTTGPVRDIDYLGSATVQKNYTFAGDGSTVVATLTNMVASWASGATTNYGFIIRPGGGPDANDLDAGLAGSFFYSNEAANSGNRPLLTIDYTVVPEPASLSMLGLGAALLRRRARR